MPNIAELKRSSKREVLSSLAHSIMLYGAELPRYETCRTKLESVQRRSALRLASAYQTVSGPAIMIITGNMQIYLLAVERQLIYEVKQDQEGYVANNQGRIQTIQTWK